MILEHDRPFGLGVFESVSAINSLIFSPPKNNNIWKLNINLNDIELRTKSPVIISQGNNPFCGPRAFFAALATHKPQKYFLAIKDLYEKGSARIRDLAIHPSVGCKNAKLKETNFVDWMTLGGLRDSCNSSLFKIAKENTSTSGITTPSELMDWIIKSWGSLTVSLGLAIVAGLPLNLLDQRKRRLLEVLSTVNSLLSSNTVILLLNAKLITQRISLSSVFSMPDHYIILESFIYYRLKGDSVLKKITQESISELHINSHKYEILFSEHLKYSNFAQYLEVIDSKLKAQKEDKYVKKCISDDIICKTDQESFQRILQKKMEDYDYIVDMESFFRYVFGVYACHW